MIRKLLKFAVSFVLLLTIRTTTIAADPVNQGTHVRGKRLQAVEIPLAEKLRSPRDTLQTLYYAIDVYEFFPSMIGDGVATLDLADTMPADSASASLLAVQLENVLNSLDIPLGSVPDRATGESVTIYDADDIKIVIRKYTDGLWRFDRATVDRIPAMRRVTLAKQKNLMSERTALREGYTDARATIKRFWLDTLGGDFPAAARALDLSGLDTAQRRQDGPALAQMLAFVLQRRGFTYSQLFPDNPSAPSFTWHADRDGHIVLERTHCPDGKDAWLFSRNTIAQLHRMYQAAQPAKADLRFARLGLTVPALSTDGTAIAGTTKPDRVPDRLASPRAVLQTFFRAMDAAETSDARMNEALECLDLGAIPDKDRRGLGATLACKLDAVLRALRIDLSAVPDSWDAPPHLLGEARNMKVEMVRQKDGCWRFGEATVGRIPEFFDKLDAKERAGRERVGQLESARDTTVTFLAAMNSGDLDQAANCLDTHEFFPSSEDDLGRVLAFKLKYILDRTGRIYIQEVPDDPGGPRYALYRGELGRIVLAGRTTDPHKGTWLFTPDTVKKIEPMFRTVMRRPADPNMQDTASTPSLWSVPGVWLRLRLPDWAQTKLGPLDAYQWVGLCVAFLLSGLVASIFLGQVHHLVAFILRQFGSVLTGGFVAAKLRPLTWVAGAALFFQMLEALDLPASRLDGVLAVKKFLLAGMVAWFGLRLIDLILAVYANSELLKPHRSLGDMIVPVTMRLTKGITLIIVATYIVYQIGQGDMLGRFLTGLGVAGLAASLAAQDALKSFFGTLLLIGERSFKIGDRIAVDSKQGIVEQVGFRSSTLRTPEGSLMSIPNSTIATASINNFGNSPPVTKAA
ncbi:MAG: mechanosensitive ion channel family protein [Gemmataceae bacterium]